MRRETAAGVPSPLVAPSAASRGDGEECDLAVIGGGAAGLAAAIFAAEEAQRSIPRAGRRLRIVVLDGARKVGAKILVSGGGRCNVTNERVTPDDFNGNRHVVRNVLAAFGVGETVAWFESMGVPLRVEECGKLFPVSNDAKTVLQTLLRRCAELGVQVLPGRRVAEVRPTGQSNGGREEDGPNTAAPRGSSHDRPGNVAGLLVRHLHGTIRARRVILATGGCSLPKSGSDGGGFDLARRLGHTVTPLHLALVPLALEPGMFHASLSGVSQEVELSTFVDGRRVDRRGGSLLWTHFGVSGPVVLDASRHWTVARAAGRPVAIKVNFVPGRGRPEVEEDLILRGREAPQRSLARSLVGDLPERFVRALLARCELDGGAWLSSLTRPGRRALAQALTEYDLPVTGDRGWNHAEVTAGGVPLSEIDYRTMGSRKTPGVYLVGEMLDVDGRIGGFNFQWAWATGRIAGLAAARGL